MSQVSLHPVFRAALILPAFVLMVALFSLIPLPGSIMRPVLNLGGLIAVYFFRKHLDRKTFSSLGIALARGWFRDLVLGALLGALLMAFIFGTLVLGGWAQYGGLRPEVSSPDRLAWFLVDGLLTFTIVALVEEILFRGYIMQNLLEVWPAPLAVAVPALLFGVLHLMNGAPDATLLAVANIAFAGIFLSFGYLMSGSLWLPIGIHLTWNLFQEYVFGFSMYGAAPKGVFMIQPNGPLWLTGGRFGPEGSALATVAMVLGMVLIAVIWRWFSSRAEAEVPPA